jgi:hypothetical protein
MLCWNLSNNIVRMVNDSHEAKKFQSNFKALYNRPLIENQVVEMTEQPTHADLVRAIKKLIMENGGYVVKIYNGGPFGQKGISDFLGVWKGQGIAIEIKTGKDKLTGAQAKFLENWRRAGGIGIEARDIKAVADALDIPLLF